VAIDIIADPPRDLLELARTGEDLDHAPRQILEERTRVGERSRGCGLLTEELSFIEPGFQRSR
jgi:hypothetical protein